VQPSNLGRATTVYLCLTVLLFCLPSCLPRGPSGAPSFAAVRAFLDRCDGFSDGQV